MDLNLQITDMAGATPQHSTVIVNFVAAIRKQLKNSTCYIFSDNVQYKFKTDSGEDKTVIPDASINCRIKSRRGNTFLDAPRFVMEVLLDATENYDRNEKMDIYRKVGVSEYWIVDWRKKNFDELFDIEWRDNSTGKGLNIFSPFCFGEQMLDSAEGGQTNTNNKGTSSILKRL